MKFKNKTDFWQVANRKLIKQSLFIPDLSMAKVITDFYFVIL